MSASQGSALGHLLVGVDLLLMLGVAAGLLAVAFTVVRRRRPDCVWMVVLAAALEVVSVLAMQVVVPALLRHHDAELEASPGLLFVIPDALSLVADGLQAVVLGLVVTALVKAASPARV